MRQRFYQVPSLQDLFKTVKPKVILETTTHALDCQIYDINVYKRSLCMKYTTSVILLFRFAHVCTLCMCGSGVCLWREKWVYVFSLLCWPTVRLTRFISLTITEGNWRWHTYRMKRYKNRLYLKILLTLICLSGKLVSTPVGKLHIHMGRIILTCFHAHVEGTKRSLMVLHVVPD